MTAAVAAIEGYRPPQVETFPLAIAPEPAVVVIAETPEDEFDRARAERLIRTAKETGVLAVRSEVQISDQNQESAIRFPTLMHAIHAAANGDEEALQFVKADARAIFTEITLKTGHVTEIPIYVDDDDRLYQFGQAMEDVLLNGLIYASAEEKILVRTIPEIRNGMRIQSAKRRGLLKHNWLVVFSRYIDGIADEDGARYGLFPDTKSTSIQAVTEVGENELVQQSAFVAGVKQPGGERHDQAAVSRIGRKLNVNLDGLDDAQTIDKALLIPKHLMPNGVIDPVRWWDEGGTFFGEAKPAQDYLAYLELCKQRERELEPTVQAVVGALLAEAASIQDPETAIERMHKLADAKLIRRAIFEDDAIDARVFGPEAAAHIEQGRIKHREGNAQGAEEAVDKAIETSTSTSCPSAREQKAKEKGAKDNEGNPNEPPASESSEICVITTTNCYCCPYNRDGTSRPTPMRVKAYIDALGTIHCRREGCGAYLGKGGKDKNIGRIARRAKQLERVQQQATAETVEQPETQEAIVLQFPAGGRAAHSQIYASGQKAA